MQKIRIQSLTIEGFRSYTEPVAFNFANSGLFFLRGHNGAGKTTLFEALVWCLLDTNLKGTAAKSVVSWKHVRPKKFNGTRVITEFRTPNEFFMIARHVGYKGETAGVKGESSLMVFRKPPQDKNIPWSSTHMVATELYKGDQQKFICSILGVDSRTFINSVIFGQGMKRLIASDAKDIREVMEAMFDAGWVDTLKDRAQSKLRDADAEYSKYERECSRLADLLEMQREKLKSDKELLDDYLKLKKEKLAALKTRLTDAKLHREQLTQQLEMLQEKLPKQDEDGSEYEALSDKQQKASKTVNAHIQALETKKRELSNLRLDILAREKQITEGHKSIAEVVDTCPACNSKIPAQKVAAAKQAFMATIKNSEAAKQQLVAKEAHINSEIQTAASTLKTSQNVLDNINQQLSVYREGQRKHNEAKKQLTELKQSIAVTTNTIQNLVEQGKSLQDEKPPKIDQASTVAKIAEYINAEAAAREALQEVDKRRNHTAWWNKALGSGGLKSYVFSAMMGELNETLAAYSLRLGYRVKFWVDLDKANKPFKATVYDSGDELDYLDLSGGQKQRINVALAFAMYDMVAATTQFNIMLLDEPFDGLDIDTVPLVQDIIRERSANRAVYVVSHNPATDVSGSREIVISGGTQKQPSKINA